jgi:hypothetical protein
MKSMGDPDYIYTPWSAERKAAASKRGFMRRIWAEAEEISETKEGARFEATVLLLIMAKKNSSDIDLLRFLTDFSYQTILVMLVRAKLAGVLFDDGTFDFGVLSDSEDLAEQYLNNSVLLPGCVAGIFIHTIEGKWSAGDQSDPDGANWQQHFAHGLVNCLGKHMVFSKKPDTDPGASCST